MAAQTARLAQARATPRRTMHASRRASRSATRSSSPRASARCSRPCSSATRPPSSGAGRQQAANLKSELEQMKAKQTDRGLVLTLGDVLFDTGTGRAEPRRRLEDGSAGRVPETAPRPPGGDRRLSPTAWAPMPTTSSSRQRRADAVKAALVMRGIDPSRINTQGYGKAYPVASNADSGGRQLNRRVEVVIGGGNNAPIVPRDDRGRF